MIEQILIGALGEGEEQYYEPPSRVLKLAVAGGDAFLSLHNFESRGVVGEELCAIRVPARSLLLALQASIEDQPSDG